MALNLNLSVQERNDNRALILADTTNNWGVGDNSDIDDLNGGTIDIFISSVKITTSDSTETTYSPADYLDNDSPYTHQSELTFTILPESLEILGVAQFTSDDELPDGIYEITYNFLDISNEPDTVTAETVVTAVIDGQVRNLTYELLRAMPTNYEQMLYRNSRDLFEPMFAYTYLTGLNTTDKLSKQEELLNQLATLERITENGSENSW